MANITQETDNLSSQIPKKKDIKKIKEYLKKNFEEECNYDFDDNTLYVCNNEVIKEDKFIELLKRYKMLIQPSLF